jgi:riboflavin kinase/FMN adenylyltransferase
VVITFDPHPRSFFSRKNDPPRIMSLEHRLSIFEDMGLDAAVIIRFSGNLASMTPKDFVRRVLAGTGVTTIFVGSNFYFGAGKSGDVKGLAALGKDAGINVKSVSPVKRYGRVVSSTWLRDRITAGDLARARRLLGRPVSVLGTVVRGEKRGREYGIPTANVDPHHEVMPPPGVYAVKVFIGGKPYAGVLNIGFKPTFYGNRRKEPSIETHILGFRGDLYGKEIEISFMSRIRNEKKFGGENALKAQIEKDIAKARTLLKRGT